jgi:hypothetical protein
MLKQDETELKQHKSNASNKHPNSREQSRMTIHRTG